MKREPDSAGMQVQRLRLAGPVCLLRAGSGEGGLYMLLEGSGILHWGQGMDSGLGAGPGAVLVLGRTDCVFEPADGRAVLLGCRFPLEMLSEAQKGRLFGSGKPPLVLMGEAAWCKQINTLLELLADDWENADCPYRLYLSLLIHYIDRQADAQSGGGSRPRNETVDKICAYLIANYNQKLTLGGVAARFYLSPYYLSRLFRRVTGQSIVDFINVRRIEAARHLLETTDLRISAVAEETGFSTTAHFRRVFREQVGVSPVQYRAAHRGGKN